ncbi:MAG: uracil-DNA glycosylase [Gemmatimonadales bacterium]|nr:uracil-DNA glycosylase [Gemmatimonadales bacterium]
MADELRARYLRQQAELGGDELWRAAPPAEPPVAAATGADRGAAPDAPDAPPDAAPPTRRGRPMPAPYPDGLSVTAPAAGPELDALDSLEAVAEVIRSRHCCGLCATRTNAVPGEGNPRARLMLVGEGPGQNEDQTGRPFVGAAGQLLDTILESIHLPRPQVFIANVVKCRPPGNRKPLPDEMAACLPYLWRQVALVRPAVLLALGATAAEALLGAKRPLGELRGRVHRFGGIPLIVTYHPAALLRNPNWKGPTWDDVRIARQLVGD